MKYLQVKGAIPKIAAIKQFAMLEIKPRTSEVDDDTDLI